VNKMPVFAGFAAISLTARRQEMRVESNPTLSASLQKAAKNAGPVSLSTRCDQFFKILTGN